MADLNLPTPLSLEAMCDAVSARTGKPIELVYWQTLVGDRPPPCTALCVSTEDVDVIIIDGAATPARQLHTAAHEAGHLLFGHVPIAEGTCGSGHRVLNPDGIRSLGATWPPGPVTEQTMRRVLARSVFTDPQELEAEWAADEIGKIAVHTPLVNLGLRTDPDGRILDRLSSVLGPIQRRIR